MKNRLFALAVCVTLLSAIAGAQVGEALPKANLDGFTKSPAKSLSDYKGRTVLIEFFAYW